MAVDSGQAVAAFHWRRVSEAGGVADPSRRLSRRARLLVAGGMRSTDIATRLFNRRTSITGIIFHRRFYAPSYLRIPVVLMATGTATAG
jgi:hypothetical protein